MNISGPSNRHLLGRIVRWPLRWIPPTAQLPVLQGELRGRHWIVGSGTHGCWLGSYEREMSCLFARTVQAGNVIYDVGANVGYYTLLAAVRAGPSGLVYAFEPLPANLNFLRKHLQINHLKNVEVIPYAVSDCEGEALFNGDANRSMGQLSASGGLAVRTVTLDAWRERQRGPAPTCLKIDVEGAELSVLRGAAQTLTQDRPDIFLATHSPSLHHNCCQLLRHHGYQLQSVGSSRELEDSCEVFASVN